MTSEDIRNIRKNKNNIFTQIAADLSDMSMTINDRRRFKDAKLQLGKKPTTSINPQLT